MTAKARRPVPASTDPINNNHHHTVKGSYQHHHYPMSQQEQLQRSAVSAFPTFGFLPSNKNYGLDSQVTSLSSPPPRPPPPKPVAVLPQNVSVIKAKSGNLVTEIQDKLFDGLMKIFSETLESLVFVVCPVGSVYWVVCNSQKKRAEKKVFQEKYLFCFSLVIAHPCSHYMPCHPRHSPSHQSQEAV